MKYRWILIGLITMVGVGNVPIWAMDGPELVTVTSGIIGGVYGAVDSALRGDDLIKGVSDGVAVGAVAPGMVMGVISGVALGGVVHCMTLQPITDVSCVGWGSAGAVIGGVASHLVITGITGIVGVFNFVYLGVAATDAIKLGKYASTNFKSDAQMHQYVCRTLRREKDPGTALLIGCSKEASDYFFSTGHTEWRDLQNDWEGTFSGTRSY